MFVVALAVLSRSIDDEIAPLAADLGVTAYEAGLLLRAPMPVIVARSEDKDRALALAARMRQRGHEVVAFDASQVTPNDAMTQLRMFRFDPDALVSIGAGDERLPYDEIVAIVRAMHTKKKETIEKEKVTKISVGRAMLTGGLVATKTSERETVKRSEEREAVVYLFRRQGPPWILRASHARYEGLGAELRPTTVENLASFLRVLRSYAPAIEVDERLLAVKNADDKTLDLLANVVAATTARRAHAYRGGI